MSGKTETQLANVDERLSRLESMMATLLERIDRQHLDATKATDQIKEWVTQFVAMRLQQLVPETCEHPPGPDSGGPYLDGTTVPCTEEVAHRVARIPIPFVRQMVAKKVADQARQDRITRVNIAYFEKAATF
ncbi:MAG: hypothetical protein HYY12_08030 [Candidatus Methylomirabilis oxyfera]|nr:hypothetical protein [Candidatus Methylomirabilis oxyfera]